MTSRTMIEKILAAHAGREVVAGDVADVEIDVRVARDFGGANVVKNLRAAGLGIADPAKTFFTFDCNPGGSDQKYATNQQLCREFAREHGVTVYDVDAGVGTHVAIDEGLVRPGQTLVSTDSHANLVGAIGAFGQGMGDLDVAHAFARGRVWFQVPPTVKVVLAGRPSPLATAKDLGLALLRRFGADGLLGRAAEIGGEAADALGLDGRITVASLATEMGAIVALFPRPEIGPDPDAAYAEVVEVDVRGLEPLASRPGRPDDVVPVAEVEGTKIGSAFVGSCTNGRMADLRAAAEVLRGRRVAPGVVLKIVPATDRIWRECLAEGLLDVFKRAGALVGNAGCAGCAAGQIGQNGPGEVTVSTGNRNFPGKQGRGEVWLASPATAAASAVAGAICRADRVPARPALFTAAPAATAPRPPAASAPAAPTDRPVLIRGRVRLVPRDHVDTDMIFHNRHLAATDVAEMGRFAFGNLPGFTDFPETARPGDIVVAGANFGCGSSRQQAVDCFRSLGVALVVARSFGAIWERNAINSGLPAIAADLLDAGLSDGDEIEVDLATGRIRLPDGREIAGRPMPAVAIDIYRRGGLLAPEVRDG